MRRQENARYKASVIRCIVNVFFNFTIIDAKSIY